ncbi:MAG: RHS repeat-associated core domain-containing protein [Candidatus Sulfotelmatobacter sp.]
MGTGDGSASYAIIGPYAAQYGCWGYDGFGNRQKEAFSTATSAPCAAGANDNVSVNSRSYNTVNQDTGLAYDGAGDVTSDALNSYLYDGEGRLCAVKNSVSNFTQYIYDAEGARVAKGLMAAWPTSCPAPTAANGFALTNQYLVGPGGEQVTELNGTLTNGSYGWKHTNVWAGAHLDATYDAKGLHFHLADPLGTRRVQASAAGAVEETIQSLPFGNGLAEFIPTNAPSTADDATENHFTGKERDSESGNDYFGARYYSSAMGRFMSPDPIIMNDLRVVNPQRWNKYAYVINNPLSLTDPTGMDAAYVNFSGMANQFGHSGVMSIHSDGSATYSSKDGQGNIHATDLSTKIQFDANRTPTTESYAALAKEVSGIESTPGQTPIDPSSVGIVYFKTAGWETEALDGYIAQAKDTNQKYRVVGNSCLDYAIGALDFAGALRRAPYSKHFWIPNDFWLWLEPQGDDSNSRPLKEKVTHRICDADGNNCH